MVETIFVVATLVLLVLRIFNCWLHYRFISVAQGQEPLRRENLLKRRLDLLHRESKQSIFVAVLFFAVALSDLWNRHWFFFWIFLFQMLTMMASIWFARYYADWVDSLLALPPENEDDETA